MNNTTTNKVAIVTGASSGIGKATVRTLLKAGYRVYAGARRLGRMEDLVADGARTAFLDLTEQSSIEEFCHQVLEQEGRIDVLVNNAGYGSYGAAEDVPLLEARRQFEVNLFGLAAMTNAVLPTMRAQGSGKVVHVGSVGGKLWSVLGSWYQATKFALEGFSDCTRNELRPFGIDVVLIQPGAIETEWSDITIDSLKKTSGHTAYRPIAEAAAAFFTRNKRMECSPQVIADVILKAVTAKKPKARYAAPANARVALWIRRFASDALFDRLFSRFFGIPGRITGGGGK